MSELPLLWDTEALEVPTGSVGEGLVDILFNGSLEKERDWDCLGC